MTRSSTFASGIVLSLMVAGSVRAEEPPDVGLQGVGKERPPGLVGPYTARWAKDSLDREGGCEGTESAVTAALRWLALHQAPDGHWGVSDWSAQCRRSRPCSGPGNDRGQAHYDVGVTALALLAYFGSNAVFQADPSGWPTWNDRLQRALLPSQRMSGCADGSWDPVGEWSLAGGRVYATAINALSLEVYYRLARQPGAADPPETPRTAGGER
jgi:hypothetical protein